MTNLEAALKVIKEAGEPLHYREITDRAIAKGYIEPRGQTPEATMATTLYGSVKRAQEAGETPELEPAGRGRFALVSRKLGGSVERDIQRNNDRVRSDLHEYLREMDPRQFELLVGQLLAAIGFEDVVVSKYSGDGGIDVDATLTVGGVTRVRTAVQVKRWQKNVAGSTVRELRGGLMTDQRGLVITTAGFTRDAIAEATADGKTPISLIDGARLVQLLTEHQIGVRKRSVQLLELNLEEIIGDTQEKSPRGGSDKSAAIWPLPGGQERYVQTLFEFLDEIGTNKPTVEEMAAWVVEHYEKVTKHTLVKSYLRNVLSPLGLVAFDGEQVVLTENGESLRRSRRSDDLLALLRRHILGVDELLDALEVKALSTNDALLVLREKVGITWETSAQVSYRLQWLAACGAARRSNKHWERSDAKAESGRD